MILCIGTTPTLQRTMIFDQVAINDVNRAAEVIEYASGKSINVARVAHALGQEVTATGFLGGHRGRLIRQDLDRAGIRHAFVEVAPETRLCITFVERSAHRSTELIEETSRVDPDDWNRLERELEPLRSPAKVVVCSGSLPPGAPVNFYARQVARRLPGQRVILDGRGPVIHEALREGSFILKLNLSELAATDGSVPELSIKSDPMQLTSAMNRLRPKGDDGMLIVTLGARGVVACDNSRTWTVTVPTILPVNAIGSGDAFAAGLACGLMKDGTVDWPEALKLASAFGVANALTPLAGHVNRDDVEKLRKQILVRDGLHFPVQ